MKHIWQSFGKSWSYFIDRALKYTSDPWSFYNTTKNGFHSELPFDDIKYIGAQLIFTTCSKSTLETLEKGVIIKVKTIKSYVKVNFKERNNNNNNYEICSKLTIKTPEGCYWRNSSVFIVNFEHISHFYLGFLLLTLNKYILAGCI